MVYGTEDWKNYRLAKAGARNTLREVAYQCFTGELLEEALNKLEESYQHGLERDRKLYGVK